MVTAVVLIVIVFAVGVTLVIRAVIVVGRLVTLCNERVALIQIHTARHIPNISAPVFDSFSIEVIRIHEHIALNMRRIPSSGASVIVGQ